MMNFNIDTSEAEKAMLELARESTRDAYEIVTFNGIDIAKSLAYNTPKRSGNLRAGWWPAYRALNITGSPGTRLNTGTNMVGKGNAKRQYIAAGDVTDNRRDPAEPTIEFRNLSTAAAKQGSGRTQVQYAWVRRNGTSIAEQTMQAAAAELEFKFKDRLEKTLEKHSKQ